MNEQRYRSTAGPALASMDNWNAQQNRRPVILTDSEPAADAVEAMTKTLREAQEEFWRGKPDLNLIGWREAEEIEAGLIPALAKAALQAAAVEPEPGLDAVLPDDTVAVIIERANRHGKRTDKWGAKLITDDYEYITDPHDSADKALSAAVRQAKENGDG